jgi:hypothetical protein
VTRASLTSRAIGVALISATSLLLAPSAHAASSSASVYPGTSPQVASLVARSGRISRLPHAAIPQLLGGGADSAYRLYPSSRACSGSLKGCAFGDLSSSRIIVLFGDSHILMWLPALVPAAERAHVKLDLIYENSCPVALIGNFSIVPGSYGSLVDCEKWRNAAIAVIHALNPSGVLIGERTTLVYSQPKDIPFTAAQWQGALATTITRLKTPSMRVAVMQDTNWFELDPMQCLAAYPGDVHKCDEPFPDMKDRSHNLAEWRAARATGSTYVFTRRWLCTTICSPVIGPFITNYDNGHLSATYASYLSLVVGKALQPLFR